MPDRQSVQTRLQSALTERLERAMGPGGQVLAQTWSTQKRDGVLTVTLTARCLEQIAQSDTRD